LHIISQVQVGFLVNKRNIFDLTLRRCLVFYVCAYFGENPSQNASMRVHADRHTNTGKLVLLSFSCYML